MSGLTQMVSKFVGSRGGAAGTTRGGSARPMAGGRRGTMGGGMGRGRSKDEAIGRGVRGALRRFR